MKRGSKKPETGEADNKKPETDDTGSDTMVSEKITNNPHGIDGVQALQVLAVGIAIIVLVWYVVHNILHII